MVLSIVLGALAVLSFVLLAWQVLAAMRFPLHAREHGLSSAPPMVLLKPLKGCDEHTRDCLKSWLTQNYRGSVRVLFGVADAEDPVCDLVRSLLQECSNVNAELVITPERLGANAKVSTLIQLQRRITPAPDQLICLSDADVRVPRDLLSTAAVRFADPKVGLVCNFYQLANPTTAAMQVEAVAINADFWSQVLQSNTLKPQDFALGAVMIARATQVQSLHGFADLADYLADDYQLGNHVAKSGAAVVISPVVVECWDSPAGWRQVWNHQLRWARTIRVSQPLPYFFSILNNVTVWLSAFTVAGVAASFFRVAPGYPWHVDGALMGACVVVFVAGSAARVAAAKFLAEKLTRKPFAWRLGWAVIAKDLLQLGVWLAAFCGNTVGWRGRRFRVQRGGKLIPVSG